MSCFLCERQENEFRVATLQRTGRVDERHVVAGVEAAHQSGGHTLRPLVQLQTGSSAGHCSLKSQTEKTHQATVSTVLLIYMIRALNLLPAGPMSNKTLCCSAVGPAASFARCGTFALSTRNRGWSGVAWALHCSTSCMYKNCTEREG